MLSSYLRVDAHGQGGVHAQRCAGVMGSLPALVVAIGCALAVPFQPACGEDLHQVTMNSSYTVANQWNNEFEPWHFGGNWVLGSRVNHRVVSIKIRSTDGGKTLAGAISYSGEGPIAFKATSVGSSSYTVQNQWGGDAAPWHDCGTWTIGGRQGQDVISLEVGSTDGGETLQGWMTYEREGPIRFKATRNGSQPGVPAPAPGTPGPAQPGAQGPRVTMLTLAPDQLISPNALSASILRAIYQTGEDQMRLMHESVGLEATQHAGIRMVWGKYGQRAKTLFGSGQWNMLTFQEWEKSRNEEIRALLTPPQREKLEAIGVLAMAAAPEFRPGEAVVAPPAIGAHIHVGPGNRMVNPAAVGQRNAFERAGRTKAMQSDWKGSAQEYAQMFNAVPLDNGEPGFESAAVLLLAGDRSGYQAQCAEMLEKSGTLGVRGYHAARACTLAPGSVKDFSVPAAKANDELIKNPSAHWALAERGALACRLGKPDEALPLLKDSLKAERQPGKAVVTWLWLAMAETQRNRPEEARAWLDIATTWMDQVAPNSTTMPNKADGLDLHNWLEAVILRKELEALTRR